MRGGVRAAGYTIVEVMIVLAVSGLMFVLAAAFINGRQAQVEFDTGVIDLNSKLNSIIQDVQNGQYPSSDTLTCSSSGGLTLGSSSSSGGQGINEGCVYIGKMILFNPQASSGGADPKQYWVISVAGKSLASCQTATSCLTDASPTPIVPPAPDLTEQNTIFQGLTLNGIQVKYENSGPNWDGGIYDFGFYINPPTNGGTFANGVSQVGMYTYRIPAGSSESNVKTLMSSNTPYPVDRVRLCFSEGTGKEAVITIGQNNNQLSSVLSRADWGGTSPCTIQD